VKGRGEDGAEGAVTVRGRAGRRKSKARASRCCECDSLVLRLFFFFPSPDLAPYAASGRTL
jgi:hypothetical protein